MSGGFQTVHTLLWMALKTYPGLLGLRTNGIGCRVYTVATDAGGAIAFVFTAGPGESDIIRMTVHANLVLLGYRCFSARTEVHYQLMRTPGYAAPRVFIARTMTCFTLQMGHGRGRIRLLTVRCSEN